MYRVHTLECSHTVAPQPSCSTSLNIGPLDADGRSVEAVQQCKAGCQRFQELSCADRNEKHSITLTRNLGISLVQSP